MSIIIKTADCLQRVFSTTCLNVYKKPENSAECPRSGPGPAPHNKDNNLNKQRWTLQHHVVNVLSFYIQSPNSQSVRFQQGRAASFLEGTQTVSGTEIASDQLGCVETRRVDRAAAHSLFALCGLASVCLKSLLPAGTQEPGLCGNTAAEADSQYSNVPRAGPEVLTEGFLTFSRAQYNKGRWIISRPS